MLQRACYEEQCRHVRKDVTEHANYDALKDCTLLERCLKETLRLRPPLVTIMRNCRTPQVIAFSCLSLHCSDVWGGGGLKPICLIFFSIPFPFFLALFSIVSLPHVYFSYSFLQMR